MRMTHEAIVERALAAEAAGFEGIAFMDHLAPPLATDQGMWEAMEIAGWVLARTATLRVGHLVLCDAFRHPAVLARQVTSLDHASGGRFDLGIGWGSVPEELHEFGVGSTEPRARVGRLGETLQVLEALWTGEVVDFEGEHVTLVGARQQPVPMGPIPVTIGGVGPRTLDLVRRHADWWNLPVHQLDRLEELRERAGDARVSVQVMVAVVPDEASRDEVTATVHRRFGTQGLGARVVIGTVPELVDRFGALHDRGVDRVYAWFADFAPPDTLARFAEVVAA
ncbi:LLM class flavin-dependent oxidoreductase [Dermatobacter hominis]|uniref:LLM class flavin-dependent oxidoreductase n=1 Tax=Dermatobacter hominis TaxID=2884263 RepID=UPI0035AC274E